MIFFARVSLWIRKFLLRIRYVQCGLYACIYSTFAVARNWLHSIRFSTLVKRSWRSNFNVTSQKSRFLPNSGKNWLTAGWLWLSAICFFSSARCECDVREEASASVSAFSRQAETPTLSWFAGGARSGEKSCTREKGLTVSVRLAAFIFQPKLREQLLACYWMCRCQPLVRRKVRPTASNFPIKAIFPS